ncbi:hypothetical protein K458DRAFT_390853 [Lentithecium fluviatile CBS 122367]|uniref:Uncharacterized protein n=1 Tax=Lentithecium fluviatile CBS 122367 TaxID=1168545 RepID=A0A6G1IW76_9PLEO|nr:hypothetical protein K458DRAFT_390853 [Lentithecium fluviatile CBS 122367]
MTVWGVSLATLVHQVLHPHPVNLLHQLYFSASSFPPRYQNMGDLEESFISHRLTDLEIYLIGIFSEAVLRRLREETEEWRETGMYTPAKASDAGILGRNGLLPNAQLCLVTDQFLDFFLGE